jgi:putative inorganic carbon (HCO3(-)) transporter
VAAGVVALAVIVREARWLVLGMLGAAVLALFVAVPGLRHRAASMIDPADPTVNERLLIWRSGLEMARDHPMVGVGPGGVSDEYPRYANPAALRATRGHLHNVPLQILVERGPLALLAWLWLFTAFFREGHRMLARLAGQQSRERALVVGSVVATVSFLVAGLFEYNFGDSEVVMVEYVVMALAFVAARAAPAA